MRLLSHYQNWLYISLNVKKWGYYLTIHRLMTDMWTLDLPKVCCCSFFSPVAYTDMQLRIAISESPKHLLLHVLSLKKHGVYAALHKLLTCKLTGCFLLYCCKKFFCFFVFFKLHRNTFGEFSVCFTLLLEVNSWISMFCFVLT